LNIDPVWLVRFWVTSVAINLKLAGGNGDDGGFINESKPREDR
jgi:hypothetical protein